MAFNVSTLRPTQPIGELNTTPLIDVLLVLLVMFILAIPVATNTLAMDLPSGKGAAVSSVENEIVLTSDGALLWNGARVEEAELLTLLRIAAARDPEPTIVFRPDGDASYQASARVIQLVKASGVTNFGFGGNERYRAFGRD